MIISLHNCSADANILACHKYMDFWVVLLHSCVIQNPLQTSISAGTRLFYSLNNRQAGINKKFYPGGRFLYPWPSRVKLEAIKMQMYKLTFTHRERQMKTTGTDNYATFV
jgi:hypothetical protein